MASLLTDRRRLVYATTIGGLFWLGAALVIAPLAIKNAADGSGSLLPAASGGINFYLGNNSHTDGYYRTPPGFDGTQEGLLRSARAIAERSSGRPLDQGEVSDYWFAQGVAFVVENPGEALRLLCRKLFLFWNGFEKALENNIYYSESFSPLLRFLPLTFGVVAPLALLGLLLLLKDWRSRSGPITLFVLAYMGTLVIFFVTSRYRLAVVPFLLLLAAAGAWWVVEKFRRREWKLLIPALVVVATAAFFSNSRLFGIAECETTDLAYSHYQAGTVLARKGEDRAALAQFERGASLNRDVPYFYGNWAIVLHKLERYDEAIGAFETGCRLLPRDGKIRADLAYTCFVLAGKEPARERELLRKAADALTESLEIDPGQAKFCDNLARILARLGDQSKASYWRRKAEELEKRSQ